MALTEEQIKNLKPGQALCCNCTFVATEDYGNRIVVDMCWAGEKERTTSRISYFYEQLSLPPTPPQHDPCRKVKKGDRVKPRIVYGRTPVFGIDGVAVAMSSGDFIIETDEGERPNGTVDVKTSDGTIMTVDPVYLELVTPVEELVPYRILHNVANGYVIYKEKPKTDNIVAIFNSTHPRSKEAAEAERDRLNAEWRKEQNND